MRRTAKPGLALALLFLVPFAVTLPRFASASDPCELDCSNYGGSGFGCQSDKSDSPSCKACEARENARRYPPSSSSSSSSAPKKPPTYAPLGEEDSGTSDGGTSEEDASASDPEDAEPVPPK